MTCRLAAAVLIVAFFAGNSARAAEISVLTPETWDEFAPQGKEVDCIYGDYVLRNEHLVAVIARPVKGRNANLGVKNVGGMLIDFTTRKNQNDQLSAYFFGASKFQFTSPESIKLEIDGTAAVGPLNGVASGKSVSIVCTSTAPKGQAQLTVRYTLGDEWRSLVVESFYKNPHDEPLDLDLADAIRADRMFLFGHDSASGMFWAHDDWFRQAYGFIAKGHQLKRGTGTLLELLREERSRVRLAPGEEHKVETRAFAADSLLALRGLALAQGEKKTIPVEARVVDPNGPVNHAKITLKLGDDDYGSARTDENGKASFSLPDEKFVAVVSAVGRKKLALYLEPNRPASANITLDRCSYVSAEITDKDGKPIPCKVAFFRKGMPEPDPKDKTPALPTWIIPDDDPAKHPFFGPDAGDTAVHNLRYSHTGKFKQEIGPGTYEVIISYGPEYDAVYQEITASEGQTVKLAAKLLRTVNTHGWVSADFHSHSSPSGDNVSSQFGRVQNLLSEHVEFAPCTEHNRVDSYLPHLKRLGVEHLLATCSGMELTGTPLPINHQNAFPLVQKPRTQDGGGPTIDENPEVQIERLALWDNNSDKLVQGNHPNLVQMLGDRDLDGKPDAGFGKMFGFMDVMEVHPPQGIFTPPNPDAGGKLTRNPIFHWMQMLNLGYRIPGVVNTDAHYNFHGSGWLRNYLASPTDDPAQIDTMQMVHAAEKGNVIMTTGPFLEVSLTPAEADKNRPAAIPGDEIKAPGGKAELSIRVECANWLDVNRVQVFVNGRPEPKLNFTRRTTPDRFKDGVTKFEAKLPLELKEDAHLIVATIGEGLQLGRIFGPTFGKQPPVAVANPIFVDIDGNGFQPNGDMLDVAIPIDKEQLKIPAKKR